MRRAGIMCFAVTFATTVGLAAVAHGRAQTGPTDESRVQEGFRISPVPLDLKGRNRALVGLGSYLVNAVGGCNDCHTCPSYEPGHNPFFPPPGGDGQVNARNYLAGGVPFPLPWEPALVSANLTPDPASGRPEGHTFEEFERLIRTGHEPNGEILQVMPWPVFRNMTDRDLRAIYEYLSAIPSATPGTCVAPGQ